MTTTAEPRRTRRRLTSDPAVQGSPEWLRAQAARWPEHSDQLLSEAREREAELGVAYAAEMILGG